MNPSRESPARVVRCRRLRRRPRPPGLDTSSRSGTAPTSRAPCSTPRPTTGRRGPWRRGRDGRRRSTGSRPATRTLLAAILGLAGPGFLAPRLVQAVLGALTAALTCAIGTRAFGRAVGLGAGSIVGLLRRPHRLRWRAPGAVPGGLPPDGDPLLRGPGAVGARRPRLAGHGAPGRLDGGGERAGPRARPDPGGRGPAPGRVAPPGRWPSRSRR